MSTAPAATAEIRETCCFKGFWNGFRGGRRGCPFDERVERFAREWLNLLGRFIARLSFRVRMMEAFHRSLLLAIF